MLVVEDQKALANRIAEGLRDQGMAVDVAYDGATAIEVTGLNRYDVVVRTETAKALFDDGPRIIAINQQNPTTALGESNGNEVGMHRLANSARGKYFGDMSFH